MATFIRRRWVRDENGNRRAEEAGTVYVERPKWTQQQVARTVSRAFARWVAMGVTRSQIARALGLHHEEIGRLIDEIPQECLDEDEAALG